MIRKKVLVPLNFNPQSEKALRFAGRITGKMSGMMTCLHVLEEPGYITGQFISKEINYRIRREAELRLSDMVVKHIGKEGTPFEIIISSGKVHRKICEKAADLNASYIVMGRSDVHNKVNTKIGTNTSIVITQAKTPVFTVKSMEYDPDGQILLPLDLSKVVASKLAVAADLAGMLHMDVHILSIIEPDQAGRISTFRKRLAEISRLFEEKNITCTTDVVVSNNTVPGEITSYAGKIGAGLIVVMTQQENDTTDSFIGSTARGIIQQSELPVLSYIPKEKPPELPDDPIQGGMESPVSVKI
jgi:nucleotide-binding universal stress UspA family protein